MNKHNKKVLLIGGTGAIGGYTLSELYRLGYSLDVITLDKAENSDRVTYHNFSASPDNVGKFLEGRFYDAIIDFMYYTHHSYLPVLAMLTAHTEQLVFVSSYRIYADKCHPVREDSTRLTDIFTEDELLATNQSYPLQKSLVENIITASKYKNKVTIVRPVISFYHGRLSYITLKAPNIVLRSGVKPLLVPDAARDVIAGFTFSGNVGKEIAHLIGKEAALGEDFILGSPERVSWGELAPAFCEGLGSEFVWLDTDEFLKYTTPDDIGEYYGLVNDRLINRDVDVSKVMRVTGLCASDFKPAYQAIVDEAKIISRDRSRYTVGARMDIESNQDLYFERIGKK